VTHSSETYAVISAIGIVTDLTLNWTDTGRAC